jgi:hypothetical protein
MVAADGVVEVLFLQVRNDTLGILDVVEELPEYRAVPSCMSIESLG